MLKGQILLAGIGLGATLVWALSKSAKENIADNEKLKETGKKVLDDSIELGKDFGHATKNAFNSVVRQVKETMGPATPDAPTGPDEPNEEETETIISEDSTEESIDIEKYKKEDADIIVSEDIELNSENTSTEFDSAVAEDSDESIDFGDSIANDEDADVSDTGADTNDETESLDLPDDDNEVIL